MSSPSLTFFCEVEPEYLVSLFTHDVISTLNEMSATISMGILDFSPERASVVRLLNDAGIPMTAWLLLPREQGYWFNMQNYLQARHRYRTFCEWTQGQDLYWQAVGIDFEPDIEEMEKLADNPLAVLKDALVRLTDRKALNNAKEAYRRLVAEMHEDRYRVEAYHFPIIVDERQSRSTFLQRVLGIVDVPVDTEVLMLYSSYFRPYGAGVIMSYAPEADGVGLGSTGGGVNIPGSPSPPPLSWDELSRDLRLAFSWTENIYIFSLEGCVEQGYLENLRDFVWDQPIMMPDLPAERVDRWRGALRTGLWLSTHPSVIFLTAAGLLLGFTQMRRWLRRSRQKDPNTD